MDDDLAELPAPLTPFAEEMVTWPTVTMRLACYLTDRTPPRRYVTSVRAVVIDGDRVLVTQDPSNRHIMPGGRLEPSESPEDRSFGSASHRSKAASSGGILTRSEGCESRIPSRLDMQLSL